MQANRLEFEQDNALAGYRLGRLEVYNWGTFNRQVWALAPCGHTSLLTGANGSGKSTLIDALLTLLVPNQKRSYNQASGGGRRERDERTYVQGAFGRIKDEQDYGAKTRYLRDEGSYTVLLAQFSNRGLQQTVSLAQVLWLQNRKVEKFFVVAEGALSVAGDFADVSTIPELKKRLAAKEQLGIFEHFSDYSKHFRKIFGLRSEKALDLFNQTVKIKEIASLNDFVRTHMLGEGDMQEHIRDLQQNYQDLTRAHAAIVKARRQLELLTPLHEDGARYRELERAIRQLKGEERLVPAYFAGQKIRLLEPEVAQARARLEGATRLLEETVGRLGTLYDKRRQLEVAIGSDKVGQQLKLLEKDIDSHQKQLTSRRQQAEAYSSLARRLELAKYSDSAVFGEGKRQAEGLSARLEKSLEEALDERVRLETQVTELKAQGEALEQEINSLQQRSSQIPRQNLNLREQMLTTLNIREEAVPFMGELLKVKDEERRWEGAIERLLHNFGLRLLVPSEHYRAVSRYVNETHLGGRVVFHRVDDVSSLSPSRSDGDKLFSKLEVKPGSTFYRWIERELVHHYDYVCCDTLQQFHREQRALTTEGLVKGGNQRHEKDDRHSIYDRTRYVLGWSNREKVVALEQERESVTARFLGVRRELGKVKGKREELETQKGRVQDFLRFDDFSAIDWRGDEQELQELRRQKTDLERSSDWLKQLREELEALQTTVRSLEATKDKTQEEKFGLERDIQDYAKQQQQAQARLEEDSPEELETHSSEIAKRLADHPLALDTLDRLERRIQATYRDLLEQETGRAGKLQENLIRKMQKYKNAFAAETTEVDASVEAMDAFDAMLETVKKDDLPRHEAHFKRFLNDKILSNVGVFQGELDKRLNTIKDNIDTLNRSLAGIDYTPRTFIELEYANNPDHEISEFQRMLRACFADVGRPDEFSGEASFGHIRALIERFETDVRWTKKVTDVRNWLDFSASENYRADGRQHHYYSDSSGKSGGQKAKLAYTILASAIAYQFGLEHGQARSTSFRFVVIDEAFDRTDERNAHYAMELFRQLDLQLLVVTPLEKIHTIEPFISACHYVENSLEEDDSKVYNLSMTEFDERKRSFRATPNQA